MKPRPPNAAPQNKVFEAKNKLDSQLDRVENREEIIIRNGKPVARLMPDAGLIAPVQAQAAAERIRIRAQNLKAGFDWDGRKADRDTGRP